MSKPEAGSRTAFPTSAEGLRVRAAVQALFTPTKMEDSRAPSIRASATSSPCESATTTTAALPRFRISDVTTSTIVRASSYSSILAAFFMTADHDRLSFDGRSRQHRFTALHHVGVVQ